MEQTGAHTMDACQGPYIRYGQARGCILAGYRCFSNRMGRSFASTMPASLQQQASIPSVIASPSCTAGATVTAQQPDLDCSVTQDYLKPQTCQPQTLNRQHKTGRPSRGQGRVGTSQPQKPSPSACNGHILQQGNRGLSNRCWWHNSCIQSCILVGSLDEQHNLSQLLCCSLLCCLPGAVQCPTTCPSSCRQSTRRQQQHVRCICWGVLYC